MRSKKLDNIRMPWPIYDGGRKRCEAENYRSFARYLAGLVLDDIINPQKHLFAHEIANADPERQDELLDVFLRSSPETICGFVIQAARLKTSKP